MTLETMSANPASLDWANVHAGDSIPGFEYELSLLRLVAYVRATGQYDFVHFDPDYARAVGAQDAFICTYHLAGLFSRQLTDWAGPDCIIRELTFSMATQMLRGDMLEFSGSVEKVWCEAGDCLVELALNVATGSAETAARAKAVVALPSGGQAPAITRRRTEADQISPNAEMPEFARQMLGDVKEGKQQPALPLTQADVLLLCEALEDWNPLYWNPAYAARSPYAGLIAPPTSSIFGAGSSLDFGLGWRRPGADIPDPITRGLSGIPLLSELRKIASDKGIPFMPPDCPDVVVTQVRFQFFAPLRIGDTLRVELRVVDCSPLRKTRLGEGYFLTVEASMINQKSALVRTETMTLFYYRPAG